MALSDFTDFLPIWQAHDDPQKMSQSGSNPKSHHNINHHAGLQVLERGKGLVSRNILQIRLGAFSKKIFKDWASIRCFETMANNKLHIQFQGKDILTAC